MSEGTTHSEILLLRPFVRERKVREGGKRVDREVGESIRARAERSKRRGECTIVGYSMARVIARRHIRNARCKCERKRKG